jgi:hypothetical protein
LNETLLPDTPVAYSLTGRLTRPKEIVVEAMARALIRTPT